VCAQVQQKAQRQVYNVNRTIADVKAKRVTISAAGNSELSNTIMLQIKVAGHEDLELAGRQLAAPKKVDPAPYASIESTWACPINSAGHKNHYGW